MNTITIGQQHYQWKVVVHPWLEAMECVIHNIIDPMQELVVVMNGTDETACNPQKVRLWVDFALQSGWYDNRFVLSLLEIQGQMRVKILPYSLSDEAAVVKALSTKFQQAVPALKKSTIKHQLQEAEQKIGLALPSIFKQLYLTLGNGNFGPDYGFFALSNDGGGGKLTLDEAYRDVHQGHIKDWDWELPQLMVPFLYWGTNIYSLIDCARVDGAVYVLDENLKKDNNRWQDCIWEHCPTLMDWLEKWFEGDATGRNLWMEMYRIKGLVE